MANEELIYSLRYCFEKRKTVVGVPWYVWCERAADALEEAEKRIDYLQKLVDLNTERCEALRKQLRESHESYEQQIADYTAAIDALDDSNDAYIKENERLKKQIAELEKDIIYWQTYAAEIER